MRNLCRIFVLIFVCVVLGCYEEEKSECFPNLRITLMAAPHIDSIQLYLNNERVCFEKAVLINGICKNCPDAKGFMLEHNICKDSNDKYVALLNDAENTTDCTHLGYYPEWTEYECSANEKNYGKPLDSLALSLHTFSKKDETDIQIGISLHGGNHYIVMAEQDTAKWNSYTRATRSSLSDYDFSESQKNKKCFDGYCITTLTTTEKEFCYEKN